MIRLFVGIALPEHIRATLHQYMRPEWPGTRWVNPKQLHLTLQFLGNTPEQRLPEIQYALSSIQASAFSLSIKGVGVFPSPNRARVLWAGVVPSPALMDLQQAIQQALHPLGYPPEKRPYHPHITLARFKGKAPDSLAEYLEHNHTLALQPFPVDTYTLFQSTLRRTGAVYTPIAQFPLLPA